MAERVDEQLLRLGKRFVRAFFVLYKTAGNYAPGHPALAQPLAELAEIVAEFERRREEALLAYHDDTLFVGELRLKPDAAGFDAFLTTMRALKHCRIGSVAFTLRAGAADLAAWFVLLREVAARRRNDPCGALLARMAAAGIVGVDVERPREGGRRGPRGRPRTRRSARRGSTPRRSR